MPTLRLLRDARGEGVAILLPDLAADIEQYRVNPEPPLAGTFAGMSVLTTPAPSRGGAIVQTGLAELDTHERGRPGSPAEARALAGALGRAYGADGLAAGTRPTGTTHVSVVDADGAAIGLSSTLGSGSGVFRHGFQLNNMLGELDVIGVEPREAGTRLPSMMTPTLVLDEEESRDWWPEARARFAWQERSCRSSRRSSGRGCPSPRRFRAHASTSTAKRRTSRADGSTDVAPALEEAGFDVRRWSDRNLFFGGVSAVERRANGELGAAGDPRRGGHGVVVA